VNAVTGADYTLRDLLEVGRRVWFLKRGLSNLFGARAEHDLLPPRLMARLDDGPTAGSVPDMELMMREFYELRGIDSDGIPRRDVLTGLGLTDLADLLGR
ncbi:MAG: aldehyde ferredoxin oxidoreductase, partial [Gemmatimonadales bacterium]|nr:aldehyde ferredoxin oxidoreductase [Gemmatimonadales bacterium]